MAFKLFLFEFHVGTIEFDSTFKPIPKKEETLVNIKFADVSINIDPEEFLFEKNGGKDNKVLFNMGKSYMFTITPKELIENLKGKRLEMSLRINQKTVGTAMVPWLDTFPEMVKLFETIGVVKAVDYSDVEELRNIHGKVIGKMDVFVRLSCFGESVETQYQKKVEGNHMEYILKNPYDKHTFKCELVNGTRILPVANLLNPVTKLENVATGVNYALSWTEIFGMGEAPSRASYSPFAGTDLQQGLIPLTEILQRTSVETISIIFRPEENKFYDLMNVFNNEISTNRDSTMITFTKEKEAKKTAKKNVDESSRPDDPLELTADKINRKLCKSKDCPAAMKFKEYGIGPLATGKGLGTLYDDVEPPVTYGLSHTYGAMSDYGPFGVYSRPKRPDQPYIPPKNVQETILPLEPNNKYCKFCNDRLRGGGPWPGQPFLLLENATEVNKKCLRRISSNVLRLRGGGPCPERPVALLRTTSKNSNVIKISKPAQRQSDTPRLRGGGPLDGEGLKSPIKECKEVMDKFDEILTAYKKALGPCGQATCPNAPSLAQEKCKSVCGKGETIPPSKDEGRLCDMPCDFGGGFPACRDPKCAYAKYKLDLVDDDAALELQFLPPTVSGKCGHPKCPYPIQPDLPPIHWDCPDPLPKGTCKNLNCPFQPRDLKKFKCPAPKPGPCGSPDCPYALPPPCDLPTCPFRPNPTCSFLEKQQNQQSKSCYQPDEEEEDYVCENPECPFANEKINVSESFDQPDLAGHFVDCFNPECPFATKGKQRPKSKSDKINICSNPSCPFANIKKQNVCSNPSCPYALIQKKQNRSYGDPQCPFAKKTITKSKQNKSDICDNPNCPYASKNGTSDLQRYKSKNNEVCDNPECPFNETESTKSKSKGSDLCDNPKCPFADKNGLSDGRKNKNKDNSEICENPDCPFRETQSTKNESKGSGIYDNPKCPFAGKNSPSHALKNKTKTNTKLCDNPDCPFNEENCSKASADCNVSENICENPECPYAEETEKPTICDDPLCPYMQPLPSCGIPGCPYEPVTCPGPKKRSVVKKITPSNDAEAFVLMETVITQVSIEKGDDGKKCAGDGDGDGSPNAQRSGKGDKKGRKKRSKFVYSMGNQYPGVKVGHKECVTPTFKVPPKMGWLWNIPMEVMNLKPRRGWKPGAIQKNIAAMIRAHREAKGLGILKLPKFRRNNEEGDLDEDDVKVTPKPTLQIQKKDGAYWITMNPLKDPKTLVDNENPYMECTPMQFRITKNKKKKDEDESRLCYCEEDESSSSSDSELDIEFTPPAGIIHPERFKKKKNVVHCEVQYDPNDFAPEKPEAKAKGKGGKGAKGGKEEKGDKEEKGGKEGKGKKGGKGEKGGKGGKEEGKGGKEEGKGEKEGKREKDGKGEKEGKGGKEKKGKGGQKGK